jgi:hypothetical protein
MSKGMVQSRRIELDAYAGLNVGKVVEFYFASSSNPFIDTLNQQSPLHKLRVNDCHYLLVTQFKFPYPPRLFSDKMTSEASYATSFPVYRYVHTRSPLVNTTYRPNMIPPLPAPFSPLASQHGFGHRTW